MNEIFILLRMSDDLRKLKLTLLLSTKGAEDPKPATIIVAGFVSFHF